MGVLAYIRSHALTLPPLAKSALGMVLILGIPPLSRRVMSATGPGGSSVERAAAATAGPEGYGRAAQTTMYNARTGQSNTFGTASVGNNH